MVNRRSIIRQPALASVIAFYIFAQSGSAQQVDPVQWSHLSSTKGQIPAPDVGRQVDLPPFFGPVSMSTDFRTVLTVI